MCVRHRGGWRIDVDVVGAYFVCVVNVNVRAECVY